MKIAIIGAGFTGLTAALKLSKEGHCVTVFESTSNLGGLAGSFKLKSWDWSLEKAYHHFFTNDNSALNLAKEVDQKIIIKKPKTDVFVQDNFLPFDSPLALLKFPYLPLIDRLRVGFSIFYLRYLSRLSNLNQKALPWLKKYMGEKATFLIWEPLFQGKFGKYQENISLTWFWARIKKRTADLAYPEGGFDNFAQNLELRIKNLGGEILLNTAVTEIKSSLRGVELYTTKQSATIDRHGRHGDLAMTTHFDKILVTTPTAEFLKIAKLPTSYINRLKSIKHLSALILVLILKESFFKKGTYWLNITDKSFPFLVMAEHTNFMDKKYYGNKHILYIGNYLPENHPYLKMSAKRLFNIYKPYLKKISPSFPQFPLSTQLFFLPNAQPIMTPDYQKIMPDFITPLKNVYLANMDMVYPWDRGVNYAIELGEKAAKILIK